MESPLPAGRLRSFGQRAVPADQPRILRAALAALRPDRPTGAFDLDSTLLVNKPRQARIVREFGAATGRAPLERCSEREVVSWDLAETLHLCGLPAREAAAALPALRAFWSARFFTSEYCRGDVPTPGAREFLGRVLELGGEVLYLTGRHAGMEDGTLESFRRAGFPLPDGGRVRLWLKPVADQSDDLWKEECHARLRALSGLACAFDNEPTHVNAYHRSFPDAVVVHLDTDHSERPVQVLPGIPSIRDFRLDVAA